MRGVAEILRGNQVFLLFFTKILHFLSEITHLKQLTGLFFIGTIGITKKQGDCKLEAGLNR